MIFSLPPALVLHTESMSPSNNNSYATATTQVFHFVIFENFVVIPLFFRGRFLNSVSAFYLTSRPLFSDHFPPKSLLSLSQFLPCYPSFPRSLPSKHSPNSSPSRFLPFNTNFPSEITSQGALISGTHAFSQPCDPYVCGVHKQSRASALFVATQRTHIPSARCRQSKQRAEVMATSRDKEPQKPQEPCVFLSSATFQTSRLGLISLSPNQLLLACISPPFCIPPPDSAEQVRASLFWPTFVPP